MNWICRNLLFIIGLCYIAAANNENRLSKRELPPRRNGMPLEVSSSMYIMDVLEVDEKSSDFTIQMYFRQRWTDENLKFSGSDVKFLTPAEIDRIWKPDLFFVQESVGILHTMTTPNVFARVHKNGTILYSMKMTLTIRCRMNFKYYPHDRQICAFNIESYGYSAGNITLHWVNPYSKHMPVGYDEDIDLPDYKIKNLTYDEEMVGFTFGNYSRLTVEITFCRKLGFFMSKLFLPYILLIITSYFGFWIHPKFVHQRMALLLSILLIMLALHLDLNMYIPESAYTKGTDVWTSFCLALVFAAFLEFIYISTLHDPQQQPDENAVILSGLESEKDEKKTEQPFISWRRKSGIYHSLRSASQMDYLSRIIYPILFGGFNLVYWAYYSS